MKRGKQIDTWYPFYIDKWLFGSTRHELNIGPGWAERFPDLAPLIPQSVLNAPFADLRGIFTDIMTMSKKDGGYLRANETTPYPLEQLAGMWCVPIDWLKATVAICLHSSVGKLTEPSPGIYYVASTETYALSDRWKRQFAKAESTSEKAEVGSKKPVAREEKRRGEDSRGKEEDRRAKALPSSVIDSLTALWKKVKKNDPPPANLEALITGLWNGFAEGHGLPPIIGIEPGSAREKSLMARLRDPHFDLEKVLVAVHEQPFFHGDNDRGWLVTFDWILSPKNLTKIMERAYVKRRTGDAARRAPEDPYIGGRRG